MRKLGPLSPARVGKDAAAEKKRTNDKGYELLCGHAQEHWIKVYELRSCQAVPGNRGARSMLTKYVPETAAAKHIREKASGMANRIHKAIKPRRMPITIVWQL